LWSYDWLCACLNFHLICVGMHFKTHPMKKHRRYFFDSFMKCHLKANDEIFKQTLCISTKLINWGNIIYLCWLEWVRVCDNMRIDMTMGRVGYGYCLLNPLSRLLNISHTHTRYSTDLSLLSHSRTRRISGIPNPVPHTI